MSFSLISSAKKYNAIDLSGIKGLHVFYNKILVRLQFAGLIIFVSAGIFAQFFFLIKGFYALNFLLVIPLVLGGYFGWKSFVYKVFTVNAVFILSESKLYYLKTNNWYDVLDYTFEDNFFLREELASYYTMSDKQNRIIFEEKSLDLKQDQLEKLKGHIRYIQNLDKREQLVNKIR